ncbi:MAG: sigma-70 family RNA polymerase sigma factor [Candidatus Eremiobacteraeota bacterium]|nr:sigma-70 family RNA polymerase sigma factor [Candidatus Eremiobacteraeota bacterium]
MALRCGATRRRLIPRERLVAKYWYLCCRAARRFRRSGLERGDLEQVGAIGLIKAVDRYRSRGAPFEAFASLLVCGEMMHYVRDRGRACAPTLPLEVVAGSECAHQMGGIDDLLDRLTVEAMLRPLAPLERCIVIAIHLECRTVVEVAARLGYSRRHVTRLHRSALQRLRVQCEVGAPSAAEARRNVPLSHGG